MIDVRDFGNVGNGGDDSLVFQAAINAAIGQGKKLYVPAGRYLVNVHVRQRDASGGIVGDGFRTVLESFADNDFAVRVDASFPRSYVFRDLRFVGRGKQTHGLYYNGGASLNCQDVMFEGCGIGICSNSSIANNYQNANFRSCYCGVYFTTRTGDNVNVTDVAGGEVKLSAATFPQHSGLHEFCNPQFNLCDIAIYADNIDNPYGGADASAIHLFGGVIQNGHIGLWIKEGGYPGNQSSLVNSTWMETKKENLTITFNGSTQNSADFICESGAIYLENVRAARLVTGPNAYIEANRFTCEKPFLAEGNVRLLRCFTDAQFVNHPVSSISQFSVASAGRLAGSLSGGNSAFPDPRAVESLDFSTLPACVIRYNADSVRVVKDQPAYFEAKCESQRGPRFLFPGAGDKVRVMTFDMKTQLGSTVKFFGGLGTLFLPTVNDWKSYQFMGRHVGDRQEAFFYNHGTNPDTIALRRMQVMDFATHSEAAAFMESVH